MNSRPTPEQLAALVAVVEHGTFEAAARRLHVTPSAVSQRIRGLETQLGQVLVRRTSPCTATPGGERLLRLARQTALLYDELAAASGEEDRVTELAVAVNADSLGTWFRAVLGVAAGWPDVTLRLQVEDQAFSADLLRRGDVLGAVTSDPDPVQGCAVETLGTLRYRPAAAPGFAERWRRGRTYDWERMPVLVFNHKDTLQHDLLAGAGVGRPAAVHHVPTTADFHEAVRLGLGWALVPEPQLEPDLDEERLVLLSGRRHVDVRLHWQRWRIDSPLLARLTEAVRGAASEGLRPVRG